MTDANYMPSGKTPNISVFGGAKLDIQALFYPIHNLFNPLALY